jgi:ATP-dependent RNA helicase SUPV3L1/SUV3
LRAVAAALEDAGGIVPRQPLRLMIDALSPEERRRLRGLGITIGTLDIFDPRLLKPGAAAWRRTLMTLWGQSPELARAGATTLRRDEPGRTVASGFRPLGEQAVRIDLVERIARAAHDARVGRGPFTPDAALATSIGLDPATLDRLMGDLGFRRVRAGDGEPVRWIWRGRPPARPAPRVEARPGNAFAALADWGRTP